MHVDTTISVTHVVTIALFLISGWIAVKNSNDKKFSEMSIALARMEEKFDSLTANVEKHNNVVERMGIVERDQHTMWKRYDDLNERMKEIEKER